MEVKTIAERKLTTSFVTSVFISSLFASTFILNSSEDAHFLEGFFGMFILYGIYIGAIVFIYGNLVSVGLEYLKKRGFIKFTWLYILLHGLFGLANGLLFQLWILGLLGMIVAILYGSIDRWLHARTRKRKKIWMFNVVSVALVLLLSTHSQLQRQPSETFAPFTEKDAVATVTKNFTVQNNVFPTEVGVWEGDIRDYHVERETAVEPLGNEKYIVSFTERWKKADEAGSFARYYEVDRNGQKSKGFEGEDPPYYK
ncbi:MULTISPECIES: hypothetical protein [Virgibacillus]|uniref:Uncharacterized protein n=2 Tax=Virgibacillus TaxID=84406 RepID=A0A024QHH5_9BACI|nr:MULTISPECIES: hypothetical protein [Virgibacillus]EQB36942.1 hypothetical protein M948_10975 [Virgibacillus sp. CM-4]MYL43118.1 hypothetical protein [Virgibacillus massiliensis]GGJ64915.1 hypothetical protein GCM10007111_28490 [Virgibacillus kapii]CDQ41968.1 hypothetical protein BN990_04347 [Virgibacillus massiliensis]